MTAKKRNKRHNWIRSLLRQGYVPIIELVQEVSESSWQQAESYWVSYFKNLGCDLTNGTLGGDGPHAHTDEARARQSAAQMGRKDSSETRAKKAAHLREVAPKAGYTLDLSDEQRESRRQRTLGNQNGIGNKSRLGQKRSPEEIAKQVEKQTGQKRTPETRAKISAALKGKKKSPEHIAKVRETRLRVGALKLAVQDWT